MLTDWLLFVSCFHYIRELRWGGVASWFLKVLPLSVLLKLHEESERLLRLGIIRGHPLVFQTFPIIEWNILFIDTNIICIFLSKDGQSLLKLKHSSSLLAVDEDGSLLSTYSQIDIHVVHRED